MNKRFLVLALTLALISPALPAMAEEALTSGLSSYSLDELAAMRGSLRESSEEERAAFHSEWQSRIENLSPDERATYLGRPDGMPRDGSGIGAGRPGAMRPTEGMRPMEGMRDAGGVIGRGPGAMGQLGGMQETGGGRLGDGIGGQVGGTQDAGSGIRTRLRDGTEGGMGGGEGRRGR